MLRKEQKFINISKSLYLSMLRFLRMKRQLKWMKKSSPLQKEMRDERLGTLVEKVCPNSFSEGEKGNKNLLINASDRTDTYMQERSLFSSRNALKTNTRYILLLCTRIAYTFMVLVSNVFQKSTVPISRRFYESVLFE